MALLIVEDNAPMRAALRHYLATAFPREVIHEAADGASALDLARRHQPRVVLMDIRLPDSDGIALTAGVMAILPDTRVIVVTQFADGLYREMAEAAGAFGYVVKDRIRTDLLPLIVRAMGKRPVAKKETSGEE